jgi:hypothetical protein
MVSPMQFVHGIFDVSGLQLSDLHTDSERR